MDSLNNIEEKKIIQKRSNSSMDENNEAQYPNKRFDAEENGRCCDTLQLSTFSKTSSNSAQSFAMPLLPIPKLEERCSNSRTIFTGTACKTGPPVGAVDIGFSKSAYYFCIALPGVKKDPGEFNCEIDRDGKVCVRGMTSTGSKIVSKYFRVFEMKFQQQCSPGPFTLFFTLPGPVDPRLFSASFRSDGIFEGVVGKY